LKFADSVNKQIISQALVAMPRKNHQHQLSSRSKAFSFSA